MSAPRSLFEYTCFSWQQSALRGQSYEEALISTVDDFRFEGDAVPEISIQSTKLIRSKSSIHHVRSTGHMITVQQDSSVTAMFPLQGRQIVDDGDEVSGAGLDQSLTLRPSRRTTWVKPQSTKLFEAVMLKVPEEFVGTRALRVPAQRERQAALVATAPDAAPALRELIRYILADLGSARPIHISAGACHSMETLLWEHFRVFLAVSDGEEAEIATESAAKVRMANDFMHGHYDEPLTVETIAMSVGASARSLQSAFRRVTGQTPWERLTAIRLEAVRHRLLSPQDTGNVTAVAMNSGFSHLGRFAALYRKTYGERPSETLARKLRK